MKLEKALATIEVSAGLTTVEDWVVVEDNGEAKYTIQPKDW